MNALTVFAFACLAVCASAKPSGHGHGVLVSGPSGIVTGHGPIGPVGHGWDDGSWNGGGHWDDGSWDDGSWNGGHGGHSNVVVGNGATLVGAGPGHAIISGPVAHGHGGWAGAGAWGGAWAGHGAGAWGGHGHGGVVVQGPLTAPAVINGPSGKIVADGLWGVPAHGHGHHGHW